MDLLFFFFSLLVLPSADSLNFKLTRFDSDVNSIIYGGDAEPAAGAVELISRFTYTCRVGRVTHAERVRIWDSSSGQLSNFTTHFSFIIDTQERSAYGHGLAFFLAPVGSDIPMNSAGGFLGLYNTSTYENSSQNQMVHVEFDSFSDPEWDIEPAGHVGINNNSLSSAAHTPWNASFHSGDTADVWITYDAITKNLSVSWSYQETLNPLENSSLSYIINLMKILPEWVNIGFSSATGSYLERNQLLSWEFSSTLEVKDTNESISKRIRVIVGVAVSVCVLTFGVILIYWRMRKQALTKKDGEKINLTSINEDLERRAGPRRFSYEELVSATNNFSNERMLGKGGFGAVYKGYLVDMDLAIAVKKISRGSKQGRKEYVTEVKTIGLLRHRNLVQLLGWCHENGEFLLVYEFMPKGSLDAHLFSKKSPLNWAARYKISLGLASALLYLHEEWDQCVVHRDVKSSNVMLDSNFNAKLGDFGLAKLTDHELGPQTTGLAGTLGYMAPEYITTRRASKESDVYSYGVVALEIGSGRRAIDHIEEEHEMSLLEWIWELYGRNKLHVAIDKSLHMDYDQKQIECLMIVGLWCTHPDHHLRPSIRQAIQVLNFESPVPNLPAKMPVPMYSVQVNNVNSGEAFITNSSIALGR